MPTRGRVEDVAAVLQASLGVLTRRLRQTQPVGGLTQGEAFALARLSRQAPATSAELARVENISPQSMGATIGALEARGLVARHRDRTDGRRILVDITDAGRQLAERKRSARGEQLARALSTGFTDDELALLATAAPLLERLARALA